MRNMRNSIIASGFVLAFGIGVACAAPPPAGQSPIPPPGVKECRTGDGGPVNNTGMIPRVFVRKDGTAVYAYQLYAAPDKAAWTMSTPFSVRSGGDANMPSGVQVKVVVGQTGIWTSPANVSPAAHVYKTRVQYLLVRGSFLFQN